MTNIKQIDFEESSGNVYTDLGIENADELLIRAQIGFHVVAVLRERNLKQKDVAKLLFIKQPDVSHLMNGHFSRFTTDKLLHFLKLLDRKVKIEISPHSEGEPFQSVAFA